MSDIHEGQSHTALGDVQPILRRFGLETTVRPSLAFYNTHDEVDRLVNVIKQIQRRNDF